MAPGYQAMAPGYQAMAPGDHTMPEYQGMAQVTKS